MMVWLKFTLRSSSPWISRTGERQVDTDAIGDEVKASPGAPFAVAFAAVAVVAPVAALATPLVATETAPPAASAPAPPSSARRLNLDVC